MRRPILIFKSIAASLVLAVGFSIPAHAQTDRLDELFDDLREAEPQGYDRIEDQLWTELGKTGSAALDMLVRRGRDALEENRIEDAIGHFSALIDHAPDVAEGYAGRATAYFQKGLVGPALDDLATALDQEPRHFGAITGLAIILEELGREEDALVAWQEIGKLHPQEPQVQGHIERLKRSIDGFDI